MAARREGGPANSHQTLNQYHALGPKLLPKSQYTFILSGRRDAAIISLLTGLSWKIWLPGCVICSPGLEGTCLWGSGTGRHRNPRAEEVRKQHLGSGRPGPEASSRPKEQRFRQKRAPGLKTSVFVPVTLQPCPKESTRVTPPTVPSLRNDHLRSIRYRGGSYP